MQTNISNLIPGINTEVTLLREDAAAQLLDHSVSTLRKWRVIGGGPKYVKISRRSIRYRYTDINQWIESHLVQNTSHVPS